MGALFKAIGVMPLAVIMFVLFALGKAGHSATVESLAQDNSQSIRVGWDRDCMREGVDHHI